MMDTKQFEGKNIAILGFWLEGKSTLNFLLSNNFAFNKLSVLDMKDQPTLQELGISNETWEHYLDHLDQFDVIFKSAGVPYSSKLLPYKEKILTQMQFFFNTYQGKVITVTASKWKSTMTSLIFSILKNAGYKVKLVGNIGNPVLEEINFDEELDFVVCELSSYMLERLEKKNYISVLGNIFPEHMDRHGGFEKYAQAKLNILKGSDFNIVLQKTAEEYELTKSYTNIETYGIWGKTSRDHGYFLHNTQELFPTTDKLLLGNHNIQNISAAIAVCLKIGVPINIIHDTIKSFTGLPHRLQFVGEVQGISFYDDAISTTPESTLEALKTFWKKVGTLFLGGTDRGYDFKLLMQKVQEYWIQNLVFFPPSGEKMAKLTPNFKGKILHTDQMQAAVDFAFQYTEPGQICLLSTASPSYSIRKNFEEKGRLFQDAINSFKAQKTSNFPPKTTSLH